MALIGIPRERPVRWINPDHISSLVPRLTVTAAGVDLHVDMKILGTPLEHVALGSHPDRDAAQAAWDGLLLYLAEHSHDPAAGPTLH